MPVSQSGVVYIDSIDNGKASLSSCKLTRHQETTRKLFSVGPESYFVILLYSETNGVFSAGTKTQIYQCVGINTKDKYLPRIST